MSEREDHFNLGTGWPLAKDVKARPAGRSIALAVSRLIYRIALCLAAIGTFIGGLCLLWCWWLRLSDDPPTARIGRSGEFETNRIEASMIALAEVARREGWTGKVVEASGPEGYTYWVTVARLPPGKTRTMAVCSASGRVWDYSGADENKSPE